MVPFPDDSDVEEILFATFDLPEPPPDDELLLDCNLVIKHQFGKNIAQFEKAYHCIQHDHLIDTESGRVIEFCDPRIADIIKTASELYHFIPSHHSLYIYGKLKETKKVKP